MKETYFIAVKKEGDDGFRIQEDENGPKVYSKREALSWIESLVKLNGASNVMLLQEVAVDVAINITIDEDRN